MVSELRFQGSGFRWFQTSGFRVKVKGSGFVRFLAFLGLRVQGFQSLKGFWAEGFRVKGLEWRASRVECLEFRV